MKMIEEKVGLKEKSEATGYMKIRPEAAGVWTKDIIPNFAIIGMANKFRNGPRVITPWTILGPVVYIFESKHCCVLFNDHS